MKNPKHRLLKALFAECDAQGIDEETLRDDIAPAVIGKRLSQAKPQEVARVLDHVRGLVSPPPQSPSGGGQGLSPAGGGWGWKKYESSKQGLLEEVKDLAIIRFGADFIVPFNNLCASFGEPDGYRKMRVSALKKLKQRLKELNRDDPWEIRTV